MLYYKFTNGGVVKLVREFDEVTANEYEKEGFTMELDENGEPVTVESRTLYKLNQNIGVARTPRVTLADTRRKGKNPKR